MPIVHCAVPAFPLALLLRREPALAGTPLVLLDSEERVLAGTRPALLAGVRPGQSIRQARNFCSELAVRPADLPAARQVFADLLAALDDYSDAVEPAGLGNAYLAAPDLAAAGALPFCQDLGRRLRGDFGPALQPAIGCDQGKFTARAAARRTHTGAVRVVLGEAEQPFLRPLPVGLLPLGPDPLRLLDHVGIRTLGQFADLPASAVFQQFGRAGRLAQRWAQGRDERPVLPRHKRPIFTRSADFDPPLPALSPLLAAAARLLRPLLRGLAARLQAAHTLQAWLQFDGGACRRQTWRLAAATADPRRLLPLLEGGWGAEHWPAPVAALRLTLSDIEEATGEQLALFPGAGAPLDLLGELLAGLRFRYGPGRLLRAEINDPARLWVERRARWSEFTVEPGRP